MQHQPLRLEQWTPSERAHRSLNRIASCAVQAAAAEDEYSMSTLTTWLLKVLCWAASGLRWPCSHAGSPLRPNLRKTKAGLGILRL